MNMFRDALAIFRLEATLFQRFPKLKASALGIVFIPALYALIYLTSVWDPAARTGELKAAIVNLDAGVTYQGQTVNVGQDVARTLNDKRTFGFVDVTDEQAAKADVRQGKLAFALIIPPDFSANAVPGSQAAGGRLVLYVSEGNNYNGAGLAKRFATELGHQVNTNLNEKRWSLVLSTATGSIDKLTQLRQGVAKLREGAHQLDTGVGKAGEGAHSLAAGADSLSAGMGQLTEGSKQLGAGLRTMDQQKPQPQDLAAMKAGAAELVTGHAALGQGLQDLQAGAQRLTDGANKLRDESKGIPIVGGRVSEGAAQLATGATQLGVGLQTARNGQAQLAQGAQKLNAGVGQLTDGVAVLGQGIHTMAAKAPPDAKLDELAQGGRALASGAQSLDGGLGQLKQGAGALAAGLDLLNQSLPADMRAPDGSARGLADSVEPVLDIVAPVRNNGTGFAPNFLPVSLWLGAVMTAFIFHLRRLPLAAEPASRPAQLMGKLGILYSIVLSQALVVLLMSLFVLDIHVSYLLPFVVTLLTTSLTFLLIIVALTRAFGDAGKAVALILLIVQLSSGGGVLPVELSGGIFQNLSPWLPFTWVVRAFRVSMFGAFDGNWLNAWLPIVFAGAVAWLSACYVGRWRFVGPQEHRPAMDI